MRAALRVALEVEGYEVEAVPNGERAMQAHEKRPADVPEMRVDLDRVLRVFANLLDTALKFTDPQGRVVLRAQTESAGVQFCAANTGPALSAAELESMFRQFWQAGRQDRRGAGLGLSICRSIVEAHGGRIWAEPEPGKRVRICFVLPLAGVSSPAGAV